MVYDVVILGAGAAGLMCAQLAAKRAKRVLLVEHMAKVGSKILISGGGRCNFTNLEVTAANFVSENPHFAKSALSRYTPQDFLALVKAHGVAFHEKKLGQLFCDHSARDIVKILETECSKAGVEILLSTEIKEVKVLEDSEKRFELLLNSKRVDARNLVVATGGLSVPKIGASSFGYKIAQQFDLKIIPTRPALDGFTITDPAYAPIKDLMGVSVDCILTANGKSFRENILFTHKGISGPAALQGSLHWTESSDIFINLIPDFSLKDFLFKKKKEKASAHFTTLLTEFLAQRVVDVFCENFLSSRELTKVPICQVADKVLESWAAEIQNWKLRPSGTVGYAKAEVTKGGVCTSELSSKTMEAKKVKGLYFIGEVVDVSGWLGGYNFQWAWASAAAAAASIDP